MNLTLVAFYGSKPDALTRLIADIQTALHSELGLAFSAYVVEQVHATIIGLEGWRIGEDVLNSNGVQAAAGSAMDLRGFLQFMQELSPFHIQIGGFAASRLYPFTSLGRHPYHRSFVLNRSSAVMVGWPVAGETYPMTLESLRRDCGRYHVHHKYHQKDGDIDNDLFIVLGCVERESIREEKAEHVQNTIRQLLANREPLNLPIGPQDLSVIAYTDTHLPISNSIQYSLAEALARLDELKLLYNEGKG